MSSVMFPGAMECFLSFKHRTLWPSWGWSDPTLCSGGATHPQFSPSNPQPPWRIRVFKGNVIFYEHSGEKYQIYLIIWLKTFNLQKIKKSSSPSLRHYTGNKWGIFITICYINQHILFRYVGIPPKHTHTHSHSSVSWF